MTHPLPSALAARVLAPATVAAALAFASPAAANVTAPVVLAGPSANVAEFGNVALAADGSGGAIWRELDADGRSHIFVAPYRDGRWLAAQRVDTALPYDSFEPRLAAAPGGRLVAVFAQDWAHQGSRTLFRLQAAILTAGARRFEVPVTIDRSVGSDRSLAGDLDPDLRMNEAGIAYLTYRVVTTTEAASTLRPGRGDAMATIKVARLAGSTWSVLGTANRNASYSVPKPSPLNAPQVSVDRIGNGVVAFVEPDDKGVARIFARRLFGARLGYVVRVSPQDIAGTPLLGEVDGFALAGGGLGAATVAVRQQAGANSPLPGTRLFSVRMSNAEQEDAKQFGAPQLIDDASADLSVPSVAITAEEQSSVAYAARAAVRGVRVSRTGPSAPQPIEAFPATGAPQLAVGPSASVAAWPAVRNGAPIVALSQTVPSGSTLTAALTGPQAGPIRALSVQGSGLGDALVGFLQGEGADTRLVVAGAQVPPQPFLAIPPDEEWLRPAQASVTWERPASGVGGLRYDVLLNGRTVASSLEGTFAQLPADDLDDGQHRVRVRARDRAGQTALSPVVTLQVDGTPPIARATVRGRRVVVQVLDRAGGAEGTASGVNAAKTSIDWGDGERTSERKLAGHTFGRAGTRIVRVAAKDKAGNGTTIVLRVRLR